MALAGSPTAHRPGCRARLLWRRFVEPTHSLPFVFECPAMERCTTQLTCSGHCLTAEHATMVQLCSICPSPCRANSSHGVVCPDRLSPPMVPGCVSQTLRSKSTMAEGSKPRVCPSTRSRAGWCRPASSPAAAPACTLVSEHTAASHGHAVSAATQQGMLCRVRGCSWPPLPHCVATRLL